MYGDVSEKVIKWDAEAYAQSNPLFTDADGMYQWDVPQGEWQVRFEKEGYAKSYLKINGVWRDHILTALVNTDN